MNHRKEECIHGTRGFWCRCPGGEVRIIPCPSHCKGKGYDVNCLDLIEKIRTANKKPRQGL